MLISEQHLDFPLKPNQLEQTHFLQDVLDGLRSMPKKLNSKYFYDQTGDRLFQKIMGSKEYYVTRCEAEIFQTRAKEIACTLKNHFDSFDLIELGAGDASKTIYLLEQLMQMDANFEYIPIDISGSMIQYLNRELPEKLPGLAVKGLNGDYLKMLDKAAKLSTKKKVVMFLGGNIGNMDTEEAFTFLKKVRAMLNKGDKMLIGFDLKKDPAKILAAYNDSSGYTKAFNLNLLHRINSELGADFDVDQFEHYPTYDPLSGACRSFLISQIRQKIHLADEVFSLNEGEIIYMELSQKYDLQQINSMAGICGFKATAAFRDEREWFVDAVWECI